MAVSNGTAALHLCTMALDVAPGDKVITTPITFAASANCVRYCGGEVVFADINPETFVIDINKVRELLESHPKGTFKGIVPVDFTGYPVDLEAFRKLADEYDLWIIEDACHAPGGYFKDSKGNDQRCGNGQFADLAIFSFHPVKHIAAGEGGMITTNNERLYQKLLMLRTHGITKNTDLFQNDVQTALGTQQTTNHKPQTSDSQLPTSVTLSDSRSAQPFPGWYYEMQDLGYNYRITDFQAALGMSQLQRAEDNITKRRAIAKRYDEAFAGKDIVLQKQEDGFSNAYHLYVIKVKDRRGLYDHLRESGIYAQVHYIPVHTMPYYRQFGWQKGDFPKAEAYYENCLSIPMYPNLSEEEQDYVIDKILEFIK